MPGRCLQRHAHDLQQKHTATRWCLTEMAACEGVQGKVVLALLRQSKTRPTCTAEARLIFHLRHTNMIRC